jgi:hypothetical protein
MMDVTDDVDEASMESFPASDAPGTRHGSVVPSEQASHADNSPKDEPARTAHESDSPADIDEKFWRKAILQHTFYKPEVGFDRYRWALRFGQHARRRHKGNASFEEVAADLSASWLAFGGPAGLTWDEARDAVYAAWEHAGMMNAEAIAGRGGFKEPPTFSSQGNVVPRNIDEPNS